MAQAEPKSRGSLTHQQLKRTIPVHLAFIMREGYAVMGDVPASKGKWPSYTMVDPRMRKIYFKFYEETYKRSQLDRKTK
jgi:hypothetical protein